MCTSRTGWIRTLLSPASRPGGLRPYRLARRQQLGTQECLNLSTNWFMTPGPASAAAPARGRRGNRAPYAHPRGGLRTETPRLTRQGYRHRRTRRPARSGRRDVPPRPARRPVPSRGDQRQYRQRHFRGPDGRCVPKFRLTYRHRPPVRWPARNSPAPRPSTRRYGEWGGLPRRSPAAPGQGPLQPGQQTAERHGLGEGAVPADILFAETPSGRQSRQRASWRCCRIGMGIQRQVIGNGLMSCLISVPDAAVGCRSRAVLAFQNNMMNEDGISATLHGGSSNA